MKWFSSILFIPYPSISPLALSFVCVHFNAVMPGPTRGCYCTCACCWSRRSSRRGAEMRRVDSKVFFLAQWLEQYGSVWSYMVGECLIYQWTWLEMYLRHIYIYLRFLALLWKNRSVRTSQDIRTYDKWQNPEMFSTSHFVAEQLGNLKS